MNESSTDTVKKPSALKNACFLLAIILLNWLCFRSALKGYFLADDFVHVDYLFHVFQGNWPSLLNNFWGNWMQAEGTTFYRPLISITLALDYLFQGARAEIFHLSNLIYQTAASLLLYLCGKEIVRALGESEKKYWDLLPLAAAMLFSVYPLHCEVVNWIIARVDSVALTFSLASFYLWCRLLNGNFHKRTALLSLFSLALALMSKEMAITVPPTLTLLTFLKTDGNFKNKLACACKQTAPLWYLLIFYLGWRSFVLGTIAGAIRVQ